MGTQFRLDLFENCKKMVNSSGKNSKKKPSKTSKPPDFMAGLHGPLSEEGHNAPGSYGSFQEGEDGMDGFESSLGRRASRRERKPASKPDLGYEEPKPIKGVKLSGASREIFRKCEETLNVLKDEFNRIPDLASKAVKFEQEIKKLRDGHYRNTMILGNSIRKFLNGQFPMLPPGSPLSAKVLTLVNKFEEGFSMLDNKVLFEENKMDLYVNRKKSGSFGGKKKLSRQGSRSNLDMDRPMSDEEKKHLSRSIKNLTAQQLKGIIMIVKDMFPEKNGMLEFDIDKLPPRK
jgi:hypothetical protein